ncbi:MAG: glycoside hydrolase family 9 protein [Pseudomonadota bacterium]
MRKTNLFHLVLFLILLATQLSNAEPSTNNDRIVFNSVGYESAFPIHAHYISSQAQTSREIALVSTEDGSTVHVSNLGPARFDWFASNYTHLIEFPSGIPAGNYEIRMDEQLSETILVQTDVNEKALLPLLRSFYLQRCGHVILDRISGMQRPACHVYDGYLAHDKPDRFIGAIGGWHDAGDYGKYVATTAVAVGNLLFSYELDPGFYANFNLSIPESDNALPDLLDESKVGLDWMLRMQREDGAVYRKLSGKKWPPLITPHADTQPRFVYGVTTSDTAKTAAAFAQAARIFAAYDADYSTQLLVAAKNAWSYLLPIGEQEFDYRDGDDSGSGPYRANDTDREEALTYDWDDRIWAAAELFLTTGNPAFKSYVLEHLDQAKVEIFEWKNPSLFALYHAIHFNEFGLTTEQKYKLTQRVVTRANEALRNHQDSPYNIANNDFIWGSNKMAAEEGVILMIAFALTQEEVYRNAAVDQVNYLFGDNAFGLNFVSGLNKKSVKDVSHIYGRAAEITIPGLLVGGPNDFAQANIAPKWAAHMSYIDDGRSYATNEYAIDYNASLIALLTHIKFSLSDNPRFSYSLCDECR